MFLPPFLPFSLLVETVPLSSLKWPRSHHRADQIGLRQSSHPEGRLSGSAITSAHWHKALHRTTDGITQRLLVMKKEPAPRHSWERGTSLHDSPASRRMHYDLHVNRLLQAQKFMHLVHSCCLKRLWNFRMWSLAGAGRRTLGATAGLCFLSLEMWGTSATSLPS